MGFYILIFLALKWGIGGMIDQIKEGLYGKHDWRNKY